MPSSTIWRNPGCFFIQYGRLKTILCRPWPLPLCKVYIIEDIYIYICIWFRFAVRRPPPLPPPMVWVSRARPLDPDSRAICSISELQLPICKLFAPLGSPSFSTYNLYGLFTSLETINQSINQSINHQSINQSINPSINQCICMYVYIYIYEYMKISICHKHPKNSCILAVDQVCWGLGATTCTIYSYPIIFPCFPINRTNTCVVLLIATSPGVFFPQQFCSHCPVWPSLTVQPARFHLRSQCELITKDSSCAWLGNWSWLWLAGKSPNETEVYSREYHL